MNTYTFYWRDGKMDKLEGETVGDAFTRAGYSRGAVGALDFYGSPGDSEYQWDAEKRDWVPSKGVAV